MAGGSIAPRLSGTSRMARGCPGQSMGRNANGRCYSTQSKGKRMRLQSSQTSSHSPQMKTSGPPPRSLWPFLLIYCGVVYGLVTVFLIPLLGPEQSSPPPMSLSVTPPELRLIALHTELVYGGLRH